MCVNYCAMLYDLLSFVWFCLFVCVILCYVVVCFVCDGLRLLGGCRSLCVCLCESSVLCVSVSCLWFNMWCCMVWFCVWCLSLCVCFPPNEPVRWDATLKNLTTKGRCIIYRKQRFSVEIWLHNFGEGGMFSWGHAFTLVV